MANSSNPRVVIGGNQPSFDAIVEENLQRGLHFVQLNALVRAVEDPRLSLRDLLVLCQIIKRTNEKTGVAFPGRARLAEDIVYYVAGEARQYSEASIATSVSSLKRSGYLIDERRAPPGGGRALSHYATVAPSIEELRAKIAEAMMAIKEAHRRKFPAEKLRAEVDRRINDRALTLTPASTSEAADVDTRINVRAADVDTRVNVDDSVNVSGREVAKTQENRSDVDDRVNVDAGVNVDDRINLSQADVDAGVTTVTRLSTAESKKNKIPPSRGEPTLGGQLPLCDGGHAADKPYLEQLDEIFAQAKSKRDLDRAWSTEQLEISALPMRQRHEAALLRARHEERIKPPKQSKPRTQLRTDWRPSRDEVAWVLENFAATPAQVAQQGDRFRDYHRSKSNLMADWSAAWRTWWGNGFHKIPRRLQAPAPLLEAQVRTPSQLQLEAELAAAQSDNL